MLKAVDLQGLIARKYKVCNDTAVELKGAYDDDHRAQFALITDNFCLGMERNTQCSDVAT